MKKMQRIIPFILLTVILGGCSEKERESTSTIITGHVKNMSVYPDTKEISVDITDFRGEYSRIIDSINSYGIFKIEFDLYKTQDVLVNPLVGRIIASPGDSIHLEIDFKDIGNIQFSGDNQKTNADIYKYLYSNNSIFHFNGPETRGMSISAYKSFCDSVKNDAEQKRQDFINKTDPTTLFLDWTKDYINIKYQSSLIYYPYNFAYINRLEYNDLEIPNDYYDFLENIEKNFSETIINTEISSLLNNYTGFFAQRTISDTTLTEEAYCSKLLSEIIDKHKPSFFKQLLIGFLFYDRLNQYDLDFYSANEKVLDKYVKEPSIKIPLNNFYIELQERQNNLETYSKATFAKLDGTEAESIFDSIFAKSQGKVIYIDFWGTGCGPCIEEMPNSKKLEQQLAGQDIEFVFICLDSNEEEAKSILSKNQLDGQFYFCHGDQGMDIEKTFDFIGIPQYMLINKKGHISELSTYLRPDLPETKEKIGKLLNEN